MGLEPMTRGLTYHFDFRRRPSDVRGLDCPFTLAFALGATRPVSTPSGLASGLARDCQLVSQEGFPDFEWCHPRSFPRGAPILLKSDALPTELEARASILAGAGAGSNRAHAPSTRNCRERQNAAAGDTASPATASPPIPTSPKAGTSYYSAGGMSTESIRYTVAFAVWTPPQTTFASLTISESPLPVTSSSAPCTVVSVPAMSSGAIWPGTTW